MSFRIAPEVFDKLPELYIGALVVKGIDNTKDYPGVTEYLNACVEEIHQKLAGRKVKENTMIMPFRAAFNQLGMNPNKFMPSIEALASRIEKGKGMPHINPIVDLGNAVSIKYLLPMGAHPLSDVDEEVRFAREGDIFRPFGAEADEQPDIGEMIYANGNIVGTRRWIWRQSDLSKIERDTTDVFFPIDGFTFLAPQVEAALDELAALCEQHFGCKAVVRGAVHKDNPVLEY
ncbi:MAG: hypothetical protein IJF59_00380 [Clostridia bacterium]|nr:hypothetical protein [Clostridia bacterium]